MEEIKTSTNVEFDVIYADGTRRHVTEGVLFEVENERIVFHNGTDRPAVAIAVAQVAAELVGNMGLPEDLLAIAISNIIKKMYKLEGGCEHDHSAGH